MAKSLAEERFMAGWLATGQLPPEREHRWHPLRKWRFDFAWPDVLLAVEIDGRGRHQTIVGVRADCDKMNEAVRLGWRVLRFPATDMRRVDEWIEMVGLCLCKVTD
jgi:very-short-patch-repair endonuclease